MTPDSELLDRFARTNSEDAFAELVRRHVNLVHSAALRQVGGDAHLAQDVAQSVFIDLARKARALTRRPSITGWLYTSAHFAAAKAVRTETRRREREDKFMRDPIQTSAPAAEWENLQPALDDAMHELKDTDREAILLRYFENRPYADVGVRLGLNENAARMRVDRALEKLRAAFTKRGLTTTSAFAAILSAHAVHAAPAGLAATLSTTALTAGTTTGTFTLLKFMTATQVKFAAATLIIATGAVALVVQHQDTDKLRTENTALTRQLAQAQADNESLSNQLASAGDTQKLSGDQLKELLKLRGEVSALRAQSTQLARLRDENQQLRNRPTPSASTGAPTPELSTEDRFVLQKNHTVNALKQIGLAMRIYADANNNQYPTNFDQIKKELSGVTNFYGDVSLNAFEFTYPGMVNAETTDLIATREITPRQTPWGNLERAYGMADGSVQEISGGNDGGTSGFEKYEAEHSPQPRNQ